MFIETLVNLCIIVAVIALAYTIVRFVFRIRKHFVVNVLHVRGAVSRKIPIKNKGNCYGLRDGRNQFYVVIRNGEVTYHKNLTNLEIDLISNDADTLYFKYHQVWLRGGGAYKFEEFDLKGNNNVIDWRTI